MAADPFEFGCDLDVYRLSEAAPPAERHGVCFFARRSTPRRAFDLGSLALEVFARRHPDVDIHLFGDPVGRLPFPAIDHGVVTPAELADLYSRCVAGLVLSATNVSLVPHEMLAAGCIPVVNDADHNRVVLDNDHVAYAPATPHDLADALVPPGRPPAGRGRRRGGGRCGQRAVALLGRRRPHGRGRRPPHRRRGRHVTRAA